MLLNKCQCFLVHSHKKEQLWSTKTCFILG